MNDSGSKTHYSQPFSFLVPVNFQLQGQFSVFLVSSISLHGAILYFPWPIPEHFTFISLSSFVRFQQIQRLFTEPDAYSCRILFLTRLPSSFMVLAHFSPADKLRSSHSLPPQFVSYWILFLASSFQFSGSVYPKVQTRHYQSATHTGTKARVFTFKLFHHEFL
jgi:hypothetical protein